MDPVRKDGENRGMAGAAGAARRALRRWASRLWCRDPPERRGRATKKPGTRSGPRLLVRPAGGLAACGLARDGRRTPARVGRGGRDGHQEGVATRHIGPLRAGWDSGREVANRAGVYAPVPAGVKPSSVRSRAPVRARSPRRMRSDRSFRSSRRTCRRMTSACEPGSRTVERCAVLGPLSFRSGDRLRRGIRCGIRRRIRCGIRRRRGRRRGSGIGRRRGCRIRGGFSHRRRFAGRVGRRPSGRRRAERRVRGGGRARGMRRTRPATGPVRTIGRFGGPRGEAAFVGGGRRDRVHGWIGGGRGRRFGHGGTRKEDGRHGGSRRGCLGVGHTPRCELQHAGKPDCGDTDGKGGPDDRGANDSPESDVPESIRTPAGVRRIGRRDDLGHPGQDRRPRQRARPGDGRGDHREREGPAGQAAAGDLVPAVRARGPPAIRARSYVLAGRTQLVSMCPARFTEHRVVDAALAHRSSTIPAPAVHGPPLRPYRVGARIQLTRTVGWTCQMGGEWAHQPETGPSAPRFDAPGVRP